MNAEDICTTCHHPREYHEQDEQGQTVCGECMVSNFKLEIRGAKHPFAMDPKEGERLN